MVLSYDAYEETLKEQEERQSEVRTLKEKYEQDMKLMKEMQEKMNNQFTGNGNDTAKSITCKC